MATSSESQPRSVARFGVFSADVAGRRLFKHGVEIRLQEQPFQVLALLLETPGEVVTREELHQRLWPTDTFVAFDEGLNAAVNRLRRALGDSADNPRFIETIPRQGYRFIAPVENSPNGGGAPKNAVAEAVAGAGLQPTLTQEGTGDFPSALTTDQPKGWPLQSWVGKSWTRFAALALGTVAVAAGGFYGFHYKPAGDPQAILACQQGRELWRHRTPETLVKAIEQYKKAVALNPSYAPAYTGLADAYIVLPLLSNIPQEEAYPKAREAAAKALALNPSLAEAHTSSADVKLYVEWDFPGAEREFRRALELDPNYATAHQWYAEFLSLMGRHEEAIREIQRAEQLEPFSAVMYHQAGQILQNARRYDEAIKEYDRALQINPAFAPSSDGVAAALRRKGMYPEAIEAKRQFLMRNADFYGTNGADQIWEEKLARVYQAGGKQGFWRYELASMPRDPSNGRVSYGLAERYAQVGDVENGIFWLERAVQLHYYEALNLKVEADLDPLRFDPRFQELVKRVGLP
jgi:DNA-binding winged helix-turn-helix (wHTH) protein/tetratricopeptide (TPR) repeat protein